MTAVLPPLMAGDRRLILARLVGNGISQAAAAAVAAVLVESIFDRFLDSSAGIDPGGDQLTIVMGGLILTGIVTALLRLVERIDAERLGQSYVHQVRGRLTQRITTASPRALQRHSRGSVVLRFVGDLSALRIWMSLGLARLIVAGMTVLGVLAVLAWMAPIISLAVAVVIATGALTGLAFGRQVRLASGDARRRRSRLAANVTEKVSAIAVVHAFGQAARERQRLRRQSELLATAMIERARAAGRLTAVAEATAALATAAALVAGLIELRSGNASAGTIIAAILVTGVAAAPLRDLGRVEEYRHNARVAQGKLEQFLTADGRIADPPAARDLARGPGDLELVDVALPGGALKGISMTAEAGQTIAIVGPNGAGKSSLLAVAARLLDPDSGRVLLDGQDLASCRIDSVRRAIGIFGPELPLLRGTILANLTYRWRDAPPEEVDRIVRLCGVDDILALLPHRERTRIREGGLGLSVGERTRIALARALLGSPRLLLLDEADANLDPASVRIVDRVLAAHTGTALVVTHRRERFVAADAIWHLDAGMLVESGRPDFLLGPAQGPTARLFIDHPELVG